MGKQKAGSAAENTTKRGKNQIELWDASPSSLKGMQQQLVYDADMIDGVRILLNLIALQTAQGINERELKKACAALDSVLDACALDVSYIADELDYLLEVED